MCTHMCESVHDKKPWCSSDRHADASLYCQISTDSPSGESQGGGEKLQRTGQRDAGQRRASDASDASDKTVEPIPPTHLALQYATGSSGDRPQGWVSHAKSLLWYPQMTCCCDQDTDE